MANILLSFEGEDQLVATVNQDRSEVCADEVRHFEQCIM